MSFTLNIGSNIRKSPYFDATVADGVRSFSVYNHMYIPGNFGDPQAEYDRLINGVAMWDVGAQRQVELRGLDAGELMQYLTTRDISGTKIGQGRYVPICDHDGNLLNDPVLLKLSEEQFWMSIADSDILLWAKGIAAERGLDVQVFEPDVSPLAVQGPKAEDLIADMFGNWVRDLKYFWFKDTELYGIPLVLARSSWSKQGGFELYLRDGQRGGDLWNAVKDAGAAYGIGPGAPNDIERIESGLVSYGADVRIETNPTNPFEIGLGKLVDFNKTGNFIGKQALLKIKAAGINRRRVGFIIQGADVETIEQPMPVMQCDEIVGLISEIGYSKRIGKNIAVGMLSCNVNDNVSNLTVVLAGKQRHITLGPLPFC